MRRINITALLLSLFITVTGIAQKKADWLTDGGDPQRTAWQKNETILSPATVKDMKLLWKIKLDNQPRQMHALFPALIAGSVAMPDGSTREIAVVAGVSDNLFGIDVEKGTQIWKLHFDNTFQTLPADGGTLCPGGLTATPVISPTSTPGKYIVYAASWDGRLRQVDLATGKEIAPPEPWMPPNGKPYGLNLVNGVIYTTTSQGCGGNPNTMYAYDLATKKVGQYMPGSGGMWPRSGPSVGKDSTVYVGTGDGDYYPERQIFGQTIIGVKQDPQTKALALKDWYTPINAEWMRKRDLDMNVSGPVFEYKGKEYLVESSKECRLWLIDTSSMGGEDHRTPVNRTPLFCNEEVNFAVAGVWGALASWEDSKGVRWVVSPFWGPKHSQFEATYEHGEIVHGGQAAFKIEEVAGKPKLSPVWISEDMNMGDPPVIANGVVFGFGSGENTVQRYADMGRRGGTPARIAESSHAVLYALDGQTGKTLWSSGDQITSFNHFSGLSVANGRVYIGTYDGMLYCFGIASGK
jgi:outer membrane protein assembly factor BamB